MCNVLGFRMPRMTLIGVEGAWYPLNAEEAEALWRLEVGCAKDGLAATKMVKVALKSLSGWLHRLCKDHRIAHQGKVAPARLEKILVASIVGKGLPRIPLARPSVKETRRVCTEVCDARAQDACPTYQQRSKRQAFQGRLDSAPHVRILYRSAKHPAATDTEEQETIDKR